MKAIAKILIPLIGFGLMACSNVYRTVDHGYSDTDVYNLMDEKMGGGQSSFNNILNVDNASLYFATSGPEFGAPQNILAVEYLGFMGADIDKEDMAEVSVFFADAFTEEGRESSLMIHMADINGGEYTKSFQMVSEGYVDGDLFTIEMSDGGSEIILQSWDLAVGSEALGSVIQFDMYLGTGEYLGRISTLAGFGGL